MKIKEFSFRNVLSYGNVLQTLKISDGPKLIAVSGTNGAGKSAIKESLTISVYGKSAVRKMRDIPNWMNRSAYTNVKFDSDSGDAIEIDRGIDPNFSEVKINGESFNLPDKKKVDEFVEDELAKIPFSVFSNTLSLSFDDFKSFVNLSQSDKRKIVDKIFGIDILTDMRSVVKEDLKSAKKDLDLTSVKIEKDRSTLKAAVAQLDSLKEKLSKKKDGLKEQITASIDQKKIKLSEFTKIHSEIGPRVLDLQKKVDAAKTANSEARSKVSDLGEKLKIYAKNRCPHCLNDLTSDSSVKVKEIIEANKKKTEETIPTLIASVTELNKDLQLVLDEKNSIRSDIQRIEMEVSQLTNQLKTLAADSSDETESVQAIIDKVRTEMEDNLSSSIGVKRNVDLFQLLDDVLSDSGIKKIILDKIIPSLNDAIRFLSEKLDFKFRFEFNGDFDPIISYLGMQVPPEALSSGQRKKMNLIVLLAFLEMIKMKHSSTNVMFLDEIFSSLDKENVLTTIQILREFAIKYNMTIFVVSHETLPDELFDSKIVVTNKNHFSEFAVYDSI